MVKVKRAIPVKEAPNWKYYICGGCGYEYDPEKGDPDNEIYPVAFFDALPDDWTCPECGEGKDQFIEA